MANVIGEILPAAIGVALSPIPIIAIILMLGTARARSSGAVFAIGWIVGLCAASTLGLLIAGAVDTSSEESQIAGWVRLTLGGMLLVLAARSWMHHPGPGETPKVPGWMASVNEMPGPKTFLVGALLSGLNPKNLALTITSMTAIASANLSSSSTVGSALLFIALASVSVLGPVILYLAAPRRSQAFLLQVKEFMSRHNDAIMIVVLLVLGFKLIGNGFSVIL